MTFHSSAKLNLEMCWAGFSSRDIVCLRNFFSIDDFNC